MPNACRMKHKTESFMEAPPIQIQLTEPQAKQIQEAAPIHSNHTLVFGYTRRFVGKQGREYKLCAWFIKYDLIVKALEAAKIIAKPKRKRAAKKLADCEKVKEALETRPN